MHTTRLAAIAILLAALPLLPACQRDAQLPPADDSTPDATPETVLGRTVARAMDKARTELANENIGLNGEINLRFGKFTNIRTDIRSENADLPRGEITPGGELLIEGKTVTMDEAQKQLVLAYRRDIIAIAEAGMDIGVRGADFGMRAARDAIVGVFNGNTDEVEKRIEAEAAHFEGEAMKICGLLPALLASQNALAASVAEFKPYARMTQADVEDCSDGKWNDDASTDTAADTATEDGTAPGETR